MIITVLLTAYTVYPGDRIHLFLSLIYLIELISCSRYQNILKYNQKQSAEKSFTYIKRGSE